MFPITDVATTNELLARQHPVALRKLTTALLSKLQRMSTEALKIHSYIWIDLEMTGLDPDKDKILEISCIITNPQLQCLHDGFACVIHQPDDVLNSMNSWCMEHHGKSGLIEASRNSKISVSEADIDVAKYVQLYSQGNGFLAGNSVYMDRIFIMKYMPCLNSLLHYRIIDVSSLKLLLSDWYPQEFSKLPKKMFRHRARNDILESIEELKLYKETFFK